ncbi:MAG TPA: hypothetical protein VIL01_05505 [Thermomicrobiales bacterium]
MVLDTGEELLVAALGEESALAQAAAAVEPFIVPYDQLARVDGWVIWCGHPPAAPGLPLLPAPEHIIWGEPAAALAAAALVSADYAARRGARDAMATRSLLAREGPIAVVVPEPVHPQLQPTLDELRSLGVPIIEQPSDALAAIAAIPAFAMRRTAHAAPVGRLHDPALGFQQVIMDVRIGGNPLSSFVVHHEGERDGVQVIGTLSPRAGIEVGLRGAGITLERTEEIEREAAHIPSFLDGVTSRVAGHSLEIGWRHGNEPTPEQIGEVFRAWLKALHGADLVDVRLAFAPPRGRSALLTEMRARAKAYRQVRVAALAGDPDPYSVLVDNGDQPEH